VTMKQRIATGILSGIVLFLVASLRLPLAYWASPSGHFDLAGIVGMAVAVAAGKRHQKPINPIFRWLAGLVGLAMGLTTVFIIGDVLLAPEPPSKSLAMADYFGLITAFFGYGAVRGRNWF
jgi:hypothetical protein